MIINSNKLFSTPIKPNFKASLIEQMMQKQVANMSTPVQQNQQNTQQPVYQPVYAPTAETYNKTNAANQYQGSLLTLLNNKVITKTTNVQSVTQTPSEPLLNYKNNLRSLFQNNQAVIYAMMPRTFNAKDTNGNGLIDEGEEPGYFTNMVDRLDELKSYGVNTLHWLPINPIGLIAAKGNAGSVYAPLDYLSIDPNLDDPKNPKSVYEEAKDAIKECHKRNIKVMVDLPSCMSVDLYKARPDLAATDVSGNPKTPEGWEDIRMFNPWDDQDKRTLNMALVDYHKKFIDMCIDLGIDGIRADVGRAKPPEFWDIITSYARSKDPEFAFLAECYTYEDASPMKNMPADRPEEALASGFDSYYGQYHIFNSWKAEEFHKFIKENLNMSFDHDKGKSLIGSFATHDDKSPMSNGGPKYCMMTNVIQATIPMLNPYIVTGYESGDRYIYEYGGKYVDKSMNELMKNPIYKDTIDGLLAPEKLIEECEKNLSQEKINNLRKTAKEFEPYRAKLQKLVNSNDANVKIPKLAETEEYKGLFNYFKEECQLIKDSIIYYTHPEHLDIFNLSRKPGGQNPEIGKHFGYLMNEVRPKYGELITKGDYIKLPVKNNSRDEVIAFARHKDGKTLVVIANHDINSKQKVKVKVPGLKQNAPLTDLAAKFGYGEDSSWTAEKNYISIDLGAGNAHIFEVDTPNIEDAFKKEDILRQNL